MEPIIYYKFISIKSLDQWNFRILKSIIIKSVILKNFNYTINIFLYLYLHKLKNNF